MHPHQEAIDLVQAVKLAIAIAGCGLLIWYVIVRWFGRPGMHRRLRDALLGSLAVLSALCWSNFFQFHYSQYFHPSDLYHYYVGAKYYPELGYTKLYECTAAADIAAGFEEQVAVREIRDLVTNTITTTQVIIADPTRCTRNFSADRWAEYQRDISWFRGRLSEAQWVNLYVDHGYNASPAWGILGITIANLTPSTGSWIIVATLLDWLLLVAMWGFVWRAFGWRPMCVALIFWGVNHLSHYGWNGGSYLRQDWLVLLVVGICCIRMERPLAGGFALACATLSRIYPAFVVIALGLKAAWEMLQRRRLWISAAHRRIVLGGLLAVVTIVPLSAVSAGGWSAWGEFFKNIRLQLDSPSVNRVGLQAAIAYDRDTRIERLLERSTVDISSRWTRERGWTFEQRRWLFWSLAIGFTALLAYAVRGRDDWVAAVLGIGLIPVVAEPGGYYLSALLGFGFLVQRSEGYGALLCGLAALTLCVPKIWRWPDDVFLFLSVLVLAFIVIVTAYLAIERRIGIGSRWRSAHDSEAARPTSGSM
jgi:hypothetical protein